MGTEAATPKVTSAGRVVGFDHNGFVIQFPYDPELVTAVKAIPGRRYEPERKMWTAPRASRSEVSALCAAHGFEASEAARAAFDPSQPTDGNVAPVGGTITQHAAKFHLKFPYDPTAVAAIKEINGRRWDPEQRVWIVPITSIRQITEFCEQFGIEHAALVDVPDSDPVIEPAISIDRNGFIIRFPYDRDLFQTLSDIPTASFDRLIGAWRVSRAAAIDLVDFADTYSAVLDSDTQPIIETAREHLVRIEKSRATTAELNIPNLNCTLLGFQKAGVLYALEALGYVEQRDGTWKRNA